MEEEGGKGRRKDEEVACRLCPFQAGPASQFEASLRPGRQVNVTANPIW
jgi:hypothetical protein